MNKLIIFLFAFFSCFAFGEQTDNKKESEFQQWYKQATVDNYAPAQYAIAMSYLRGNLVEKDQLKAIEWLEKSAKQGYVDAQSYLGMVYYWGGSSIDIDYTKAFYWNEKAAEQGDAVAEYYMGLMFYKGIGVNQNKEKAFYWFTKCTENDNHVDETFYYLGLMYVNGEAVNQDYTKARALFEQVDSDPRGFYRLGIMYANGIGGEQNYENARKLLEKVAVTDAVGSEIPKSLIYLIYLTETGKIKERMFSNSTIYSYLLVDYFLKPFPFIHNKLY